VKPSTLLLALPLLAGCKSGLPKMPDLSELLPKVTFEELAVKELDFQDLDGRFVLQVENPYPVELAFEEASWKLGLAGHPFLDGSLGEGLAIEPAGESRVRLPFTLGFADALRVAGDVADGQDELPYSLEVDLGFRTPVGPARVPLRHEDTLPALRTPQLSLKALRVGAFEPLKNKASLELDVNLHSDQPSAVSFDRFAWKVKLAGNDAASGDAEIGPVEGDRLVTLPIRLDLLGLGAAVVEALTDRSELKVRLTADATVGTPFGAVPLAIDEVADLTPR
jgi:hypothetical protein